MDKKKLNEEIVLCRAVVKRAKVCVIRKLIKKIKMLRSCKKEEVREKKLRKGRRLAAEVHMMKTLRPDYVTKFGLLTENYVPAGSNTKLKRKRNACAKLIKHKELVEKINSIRDKFSNWQEELPVLLNSSKKKMNKDEEGMRHTEGNETNDAGRTEEITLNEESLSERLDGSRDEEPETKNEITKISKTKVKKPKISKTKLKSESSKVGNAKNKVKKKEDDCDIKNNNSDTENVEQKIEDPFFIGKKVTVPVLLQKGNEDHPENEKKKIKNEQSEVVMREDLARHCDGDYESRKIFNKKSIESVTQDEIHPSWKAKKIQMIKPFEGKKIKFE